LFLFYRAAGLNIAVDIDNDINGDKMPSLTRHWMRHTAIVPKGFIRYHALESLYEKPMSGSEIINDVEKRTGGCWKPSPGSIYPLLAWLQDSGYVKEVPKDQSGMKRYELTDRGRILLEEQRKIKSEFRRAAKFFPPPLLGGLWFRIPPEKTIEVREAMRKLLIAFFELGNVLEEKFSEQALKEALKILNETAQKLEEIDKKLRGEKT
jgi:DNA-binding PadR family transcriptional regulator